MFKVALTSHRCCMMYDVKCMFILMKTDINSPQVKVGVNSRWS